MPKQPNKRLPSPTPFSASNSATSAPSGNSSSQQPVGIHHELFGCAFVEIDVAFRRIVQLDHSYVHRLCDLNLVVENRLHELAIVLQDRRLPRLEGMAFGPAETQPNRK